MRHGHNCNHGHATCFGTQSYINHHGINTTIGEDHKAVVGAMAQCGGILLLNKVDRPREKLVYFMAIENAKFRKPVLPGDTIRFELTLIKLKGRICKMAGKAFVDGALVAEADLMSTVVER